MKLFMKGLLLTLIILVMFAFPACAVTYVQGTHVSDLDSRDDSYAGAFDIGFSFPFYGVNQTQFHVTTNGVVSLGGASYHYSNKPLETSGYNYPAVFPFWDDLHPSYSSNVNGYILYNTIAEGEHGNPYGADVLVVQWTNYGFFGSELVMGTFQAHMVSDGRVIFNYNDLIAPERAYGQSATIGIQQNGSGSYVQHSYNGDAGIRSGHTVRFNYENGTYTDLGASTDGFWDMLLFKEGSVQPPGKPQDPTPSIGAVASTSPTLGWSTVDNADDYSVIVSPNSNLNSPVYNEVVTGNSTTVPSLSAGSTYYWQVIARNSGGDTPSDQWNFVTTSNTRTLVYTAGSNGSISGSASQTVAQGGDGVAVTAVTDAGYHFVQWSDGSTDNPRTDTNVMDNISVEASFLINTYTLTYVAGSNGLLTGNRTQNVTYGDDSNMVTAVPDTGYHFGQWSDGSTDNPRTDTNVMADITVTAEFPINQAPATPGPFTSPTAGQKVKGGQTMNVDWGTSTDPEDDAVKYDLWFFNGTWAKMGDMLNNTHLEFILPSDNTDNAMFRVYANDTIANSSARDVTFTIDSIAPELSVSGNPSDWQNTSAEINVSVTDMTIDTVKWDSGTYDASYFGTGGNVLNSPYTFSANSNGLYTVYAIDSVGNENLTVFEISKIDKEVPCVVFGTNGNTTYENSHSTTVSVTDFPSGIQGLEYSWNQDNTEGSVVSWTEFNIEDVLTKDSVNGDWYLHVKATDNAENINYSVSNVFKIDNEPPVYNWVQKVLSANTGENITIELNAIDNIEITSGNIIVDGQNYHMEQDSSNYSWNISIPASDSGTLVSSIVYNCTFSDLAGNTNTTDDIHIDVAILPIADLTADVTRGILPLNVSFQDNSSGLVENWHWDFGDGNSSTDQNPTHEFDSGNFTVNLTVSNVNGTSTKYLNVRAAEEPVYTLSPEDTDIISVYGEELNFSVATTLFSSSAWFIDGNPINGSGIELYDNAEDSSRISYCNINTSQYIDQDEFFMEMYNVSVNVGNESIGRVDTFSWEWTVTDSSANEGDEIDFVVNSTPEIVISDGESEVSFNTTDNNRTDNNGIACSIKSVSFNTSSNTDGILIKVEVMNRSSLNESLLDFPIDSVYQYLDISFSNETLVNNESNNQTIEFRVLNDLDGGTLIIKTVYLKHWSSTDWESYTPELIDYDGTYSYFIVRNISGFSPFAVICDYDHASASVSTSSSDDGLPAYLKWLMFKERSENLEEDMDIEIPEISESTDGASKQIESGIENTDPEDIDSVKMNGKTDSNKMKILGISLVAALAILLIIFRKKKQED